MGLRRLLGATLLLMLAVVGVGRANLALADDPPAPKPKVLIAHIGAQPKDGVEGSTDHAPPPPGQQPPHSHPTGQHGQAVEQREAQMTEEGYEVEVRYFTDMQAFLCWARAQAALETPPQYRHVEFYGHGNNSGPVAGFHNPGEPPPPLTNPEELARWEALGELLRRLMTRGDGQNGHIVFGWCKSGGSEEPEGGGPLAGGKYPGGVVAGKSGHPVYGPGGDIGFPYRDPPLPLGAPYSEPSPVDSTPTDTGWDKFPPVVDGQPNDGRDGPLPVPPTERTGGRCKLPFGEGATPGQPDPHEGNGTPQPTPSPDNEPVGPVPTPEPELPSAESIDC